MNIFRSFEIFLREPLSILRERFIQIVNINSNLTTQASVNAELIGNKAQITIVNSEKIYKLCKTVAYKQRMLESQNLLPTPTLQVDEKEVVIGQLFERKTV
jgi:hypothetical protein